MNVLYLLHGKIEGVQGGSELHTLDLMTRLPSGFTAYLAFPDEGRLWFKRRDGGVVNSIPLDPPASPYGSLPQEAADFLVNQISRFHIELVHIQHVLNLGPKIGQVIKSAGIPYLYTAHDYFFWCVNYSLLRDLQFCGFERDPHACVTCLAGVGVSSTPAQVQLHRNDMADFLAGARAIVVPSATVAHYLKNQFSELAAKRIEVVPHGSDPPSRTFSRAGRKSETLNVAFLGSFVPMKGSHYFLEAARSLQDEPGIRLFVIGAISPHFNSFDFPRNVVPLGQYSRPRLPDLLTEHEIDVVTLLSPWPETFSYTLSEAVLAGLPVIACDLGALRERISSFGNGVLLPADNPVPRLVALLRRLAQNRRPLQVLARQSIEARSQIYTAAEVAKRYAALYEEILGQSA